MKMLPMAAMDLFVTNDSIHSVRLEKVRWSTDSTLL